MGSFDSNAAVKKEISTQSAAANWNSKTDAPSDSTGSQFVRDPFHPGAPAGGYRDPLDSGIECNEGLVRVRIRPDSHGRFGFNIRGGTDVGTPIIVSRVGQNMPADLCIPRLSEGDQLLSVNGRTVTRCTHAEVINLIRASKSDPAGLLELLVKQSDYVTDDLNGEALGPDSGDAPAIPPRTAQINSRQIGLGRLSNRTHRHSLSAQHLSTIAGRSTHAETKNSPLVQSMMELEVGLSDGSLLAQFEQLPRRKSGFTTNAARLTENEFKNRYRDISPYDQTRVILQRGPGDYINASFVIMDFPKAGFAVNYIAAQGPLLSTYGDFWQMCWEQHVTVIVMLTAVSERGRVKCHQYWPDLGQSFKFTTTAPIGPVGQRDPLNLQVQTMKEEVAGEFAFREFTLTQTASSEAPFSNECRRVEQLQHTSWPDHGTPSNMVELIEFVQRIREKRGKSTAPIVVHCSAGIGRTGVLIAMETAMNLMERAQPVRPIELVQLMRAQRALLIQTAVSPCLALNK
ncbi:unnamed protein product [Dicrocoelium dendriticum]|nr:unnamed protein product [Dicrocoelium dendriticum]